MGTEKSSVSSTARPQWTSSLTFVIAAAGSAVGLGNIWKFPYIAGVNGGGAFVLVYLLIIFLIGAPLMAAEILIGKSTQCSPVKALKHFMGEKTPWRLVGLLSVVTSFAILSFYSVVSGWTLHYLILSLKGSFSGQSPETISGMFDALYGDGTKNLFWHFVVMAIVTFIGFRGVKRGIERSTVFMMPVLIFLLLILLGNSLTSSGAKEGIHFLFYPDFSKLTGEAILEAMGHAFFTLSLGMGTMITYGSYLPKENSLAKPVISVVFADTAIALLAGLVIFPIVFSHGLEAGAGPGLVFQTIPIVFSKIAGGGVLSVLFFLLLFIAALTSAISMFEVAVAWAIDGGHMKRRRASIVIGVVIFAFGILSALSGGALSHITIPGIEKNIFDSLDYLVTNWALPLGGFFTIVLVGWFLPADVCRAEFKQNAPIWWSFRVFRTFCRYVTPIGILIVFFHKLGLF